MTPLIVTVHGKKRRARCSTGLNNVLLPTLFTFVNNTEQYCWAWIGCNNIVQYCWQLWTMWASKTLFNPVFINIASTWTFLHVYFTFLKLLTAPFTRIKTLNESRVLAVSLTSGFWFLRYALIWLCLSRASSLTLPNTAGLLRALRCSSVLPPHCNQ
jgi:hypothetical protein